jgi:Predicted nucleic-acid-binding protein implicated in transcription termination
MRPRHVPIRTCVACRTSGDKRGLLRVVRNPEGGVAFDVSGKANGRGAYICAAEPCIKAAQKQNKLGRSLKTEVPSTLYEELLLHANAPVEG